MRSKRLTTKSGSVYHVNDSGAVSRIAGRSDIVNARFQYTIGFFTKTDYPDGLDQIQVGNALFWNGIVNDFTEPVKSTVIVFIDREEG